MLSETGAATIVFGLLFIGLMFIVLIISAPPAPFAIERGMLLLLQLIEMRASSIKLMFSCRVCVRSLFNASNCKLKVETI